MPKATRPHPITGQVNPTTHLPPPCMPWTCLSPSRWLTPHRATTLPIPPTPSLPTLPPSSTFAPNGRLHCPDHRPSPSQSTPPPLLALPCLTVDPPLLPSHSAAHRSSHAHGHHHPLSHGCRPIFPRQNPSPITHRRSLFSVDAEEDKRTLPDKEGALLLHSRRLSPLSTLILSSSTPEAVTEPPSPPSPNPSVGPFQASEAPTSSIFFLLHPTAPTALLLPE